MKHYFSHWLKALWNKRWLVLLAIFLTFFSNFITHLAGSYTDSVESAQSAPDFILDSFGPYDLNILFVWFLIFVCFVFYAYSLFIEPEKFHYYVIFAAILGLVRAGFITLTHLKSPVDVISATYPSFFNFLTFSNDLFFSGHTAFPFLGFLIFKNPWIKYFMLVSSIILGASTILMHQHYSIDVFAAFFITYGIYRIGTIFFHRIGWLEGSSH
ncbi:MAG: phosphatase PAP2-related protein [Nanoarchaeota archaeon]